MLRSKCSLCSHALRLIFYTILIAKITAKRFNLLNSFYTAVVFVKCISAILRYNIDNWFVIIFCQSTALLDHLAASVTPACEFNTNNIKILDACTGDLKLRFAESIHLKHSKQTLNTQERSIPLKII